MEKNKVRIVSNSIYLGKLGKKIKELSDTFIIYIHDGRVILEPLIEVRPMNFVLFYPQNKEMFESVKRGISHAGNPCQSISWDEFKKKHNI